MPQPAPARRPGRPGGHRAKGDEREAAILATTERLLGERALHDLSVDDLARGAGISRPTFYFYFPSKEAVVLTLLQRVADEADAARRSAVTAAPPGPPADPADRWRRAIGATLETLAGHRNLARTAAELQLGSPAIRALWCSVMEGLVQDAAEAIDADRRRGVAAPGVAPRDLAVALTWMTERVVMTALAGDQPSIPLERTLDVLLSVWLRAIYGG